MNDDFGPSLAPPFAMNRRRFLTLSLGGAAALALEACSGDSGKDSAHGSRPTVRLPHGAFGFPSPFASNGPPGYVQMSLLYDTLLWKDSTGTLLPWLAKSMMRSADNLTYTFELRSDVKWSDGKPFTSADVAFTFQYYARLQALPPPVIIQPPQGVAKVKAMGPTTVEITLSDPDVTFAELVAGALPIVPEHVWSAVKDPTSVQNPKMLVGTGAYRLGSYKGDGGPLLYTANDAYFLGKPFAKRIEFTEVADDFTALLSGAIDAGEAGFGAGLRPDVLAPIQRDKRFGMLKQQGNFTTALYWNLKKGGALADARFRRACAMAIDRADLVKRLAGGFGQPGNPGFLSRANSYYADVPQYELDVAGANSLLDAAGYRADANGERQGPRGPLAFELLLGNDSVPLAELIVPALKQIGVTVRPKAVQGGPQLFGPKFSGQFDMALLGYPGPSAGGPNGDPDSLRRVFSSHGPPSLTGASGYANPAFEGLAQQQRMAFDVGARKALVAKMQKIIAEDIPILPLYYPEVFFAYRKSVLDQWYFTPGEYPTSDYNKQLLITGKDTGTAIRTPGK